MNEPTEKSKTIDDVCGQPKGTFKEFVKGQTEPTELQKAVELLPCPFCGGEAKIVEVGNDRTPKRSVIIKCEKCKVKRTNSAICQDMEWLINVSVEQWNARPYAKQPSALQGLSDLHRDEFIRIRAIATDTEIQGLCDRAVTQIEQHVPLIVQRDSAVRQYLEVRVENEEATKKLKHVSRLLDVCAQMGSNATDAEVAASASFKEAIAYTELEAIEQECDSLTTALKECAEALPKPNLDGAAFGKTLWISWDTLAGWHGDDEKARQIHYQTRIIAKGVIAYKALLEKSLSNPHVKKLLKP